MSDRRCVFCGLSQRVLLVGGMESRTTKEFICDKCITDILVLKFDEISTKGNMTLVASSEPKNSEAPIA